MTALTHFPPTRAEALSRLNRFLPKAGKTYAARRNYDLGAGQHNDVSTLSPYLRTRLITEEEVLHAVLSQHSPSAAEKFIQEIYWRTYWKGWLEMRPAVWMQYQSDLARQLDNVQTQSGLRGEWESACKGETGIDCFDHWAHELTETGYLHNHARMWFASIWIFTLGLPWELGADFFLRHLLDGDPASNTLGWRWVAGIQTPGKTYLARVSNISKFTEGRFHPKWQLAGEATAIPTQPAPERTPLPLPQSVEANLRTGLLVHTDDLCTDMSLHPAPTATAVLRAETGLSPLLQAPHIGAFHDAAIEDALTRLNVPAPTVTTHVANDIAAWVKSEGLEQLVTAYAPVGPTARLLDQIEQAASVPVIRVRRDYDSAAWPHATHGFFRFKDKIPSLLRGLNQPSLAL